MKLAIAAILSLILLSGCAFFNVSLTTETKPIVEQVLEGKGKAKILLLDLDGTISFREEKEGFGGKRKPSKVAFFREALRKAESDKDIAGVIVRINSPGGTATASDVIYHEVMNLREARKIPVYAYFLELGTSGAYYVACAADRIFAGPTAVTGSIGVIALRLDLEGLFSKVGVSSETFRSGPKKDFWSPFRPSTPQEKEMLQSIVDTLYARFLDVVYVNRQKDLSQDQIRTLADGRILTAMQAKEARLIDGIFYLDEAVNVMKRELGIQEARVVTYARPRTFKSNLYSEISEDTLPKSQVINLISINADDLPLFSGIRFMYLWTP